MDCIGDTRRKRLGMLVKQHGSMANLLRALSRSTRDATLSQYINESKDSKTNRPRDMGTRIARNIESALKLEEGWMDQPVVDDQADVRRFPQRQVAAVITSAEFDALDPTFRQAVIASVRLAPTRAQFY